MATVSVSSELTTGVWYHPMRLETLSTDAACDAKSHMKIPKLAISAMAAWFDAKFCHHAFADVCVSGVSKGGA